MTMDDVQANEPGREWPVMWVVAGLMLLVAGLAWGFAAASYAHAELSWRTQGVQGSLESHSPPYTSARKRALRDFLGNAIERIPEAPAVFTHVVTKAPWLGVLFIAAELTIAFLGWKLKRLSDELSAEDRRRRPRRHRD